MLTENQMILVKLEEVTGTDPTPDATNNFLAVHNVQVTPQVQYHSPAARDGSLSPRAGVLGQKYYEISFDHELQVNNSTETLPPCDPLLQACGWDDNEESATDGKYYPASPRGLKCTRLAYDSGGTTEIEVGNTVTGETSGAQAVVKAITEQSGTWAGGDSVGVMYLGPITRTPGKVTFTGSGLNDATSGGTATNTADATYTIVIDGTGATDTFKWQKDSGAWTETVNMTGAAQTLTDGVTVTFGATTGHTETDQWVIECNQLFDNDEAILVSAADCGTVNGTQWMPSVTIWAYYEDVVYKLVGCKGDVSWNLTSGAPAILSFKLTGEYATPSDTTFPTSWTDLGGAPLVAMGGTFTFGSITPCVESLVFGLNNEVAVLPCMGDAAGVSGIQITNRKPECTFNPEVEALSEADYWTLYGAVTQSNLTFSMTNSTVTASIALNKCEIKSLPPGERNGVNTWDITAQPTRSAASAGEDEMYVQFAATV